MPIRVLFLQPGVIHQRLMDHGLPSEVVDSIKDLCIAAHSTYPSIHGHLFSFDASKVGCVRPWKKHRFHLSWSFKWKRTLDHNVTTSITLRETCYKIPDVYFGHSTHEQNHWIMDGSADLLFFLFPRFCGVCVTLQNRLCIAACSSLIPSAHERHDHGPCPSACPCPDQQIANSGYFEATESNKSYESISIF